ncbi:MAG: tRNA pseudouridine(55) synthase TruB [Oscillospiraceae bacterium]|jgi:tRNA pseudouridine55 synthase|nr:tRNA pseudouridine(55) synthase TruB [Oscillospiraceae bacterium]
MNGILVINKPPSFTSFDVVAIIRRLAGTKKVGHCGTLDPNATGVLPITIGNATKAQDIFPDHSKAYTAGFRFGICTNTLDIWGTILQETKANVSRAKLEEALGSFCGSYMQVPPMYSAVKQNGQKLCNLARKGIIVERPAKKVEIFKLALTEFDEQTQSGVLEIDCGEGTYVRALIDDIAKHLGTLGVMTSLVRTRACGYDIATAITIEQAKTLAQNGQLETAVLPTESIFAPYPAVAVSAAQALRFKNGGALDLARLPEGTSSQNGTIFKVYSPPPENDFLGLGVVKETELKIFKMF